MTDGLRYCSLIFLVQKQVCVSRERCEIRSWSVSNETRSGVTGALPSLSKTGWCPPVIFVREQPDLPAVIVESCCRHKCEVLWRHQSG